jgi:hypothetical protein
LKNVVSGGNMAITGQVVSLIKQFQKENPKAGKVEPSRGGGERSALEQLEIILQPKRKKNYLNIKKRFLEKFSLRELPEYKALTPDQTKWWISEINKQAGKPNGFAHVGGKAQDVSLKNLNDEEREKLRKTLEQGGFGVLNEYVTETDSDYKVSAKKATVYHVYKK